MQPVRSFTLHDVNNQHKFEKFFWSGVNAHVKVFKDVATADTICETLRRVIRAIISAIQVPFFCAGAGLFALYGYANRSTQLEVALTTNQPLTHFSHHYYPRMPGTTAEQEPLNIHGFCHYIRENKTLQSIVIYNTPDSKALKRICRALEGNTTLQKLEIHDSLQTLGSIRAVGMLLLENKTLKTLKLIGCGIQNPGVESIMEGLRNNSSLVSLDLSHNPITHVQFEETAQALRELNFIKTSRLNFVGLAGSIKATGQAGIENLHLSFDFTELDGSEGLAQAFAENQVLNTLVLSGDKLYRTSSYKCPLNWESAEILFDALNCSTTLKTLVLRDGAIGGDAMDEIVEGLVANTTLEAFGIVNDLLFPDSITKLFEGLSRNPRITQLKLEDCLPNKFFSRQDMVDLIANNTTITHLDLSRNWRIGLGGIDGLRHIIENNKTLKFINLAACDLTVEQLQGIVQALENNTTLTGLQLDRDIDPAIAAEITRLLERNRNE